MSASESERYNEAMKAHKEALIKSVKEKKAELVQLAEENERAKTELEKNRTRGPPSISIINW
jgi:hypothetical protein